MSDCLHARILLDPPCGDVIKQDWHQRLDAVVPKVSRALDDIRSVLTEAGYGKDTYQLIQLSPLALGIPEELRNLSACPFNAEDLAWNRDRAVGSLSDALREAAARADAPFLDLSQAGPGHEACTGGDDPGSEWFTRLTPGPELLSVTPIGSSTSACSRSTPTAKAIGSRTLATNSTTLIRLGWHRLAPSRRRLTSRPPCSRPTHQGAPPRLQRITAILSAVNTSPVGARSSMVSFLQAGRTSPQVSHGGPGEHRP